MIMFGSSVIMTQIAKIIVQRQTSASRFEGTQTKYSTLTMLSRDRLETQKSTNAAHARRNNRQLLRYTDIVAHIANEHS